MQDMAGNANQVTFLKMVGLKTIGQTIWFIHTAKGEVFGQALNLGVFTTNRLQTNNH